MSFELFIYSILNDDISVSVAPVRSISVDSAHGSLKNHSTSTQNTSSISSSRVSPSGIFSKRLSMKKPNQLEKECSQDSAVSVFSEHDHGNQKSPKSSGSEDCFTNSTTVEKIEEEAESPIFSTGTASMEYDDMFEMYSDIDGEFQILKNINIEIYSI